MHRGHLQGSYDREAAFSHIVRDITEKYDAGFDILITSDGPLALPPTERARQSDHLTGRHSAKGPFPRPRKKKMALGAHNNGLSGELSSAARIDTKYHQVIWHYKGHADVSPLHSDATTRWQRIVRSR